MTAPPPPTSNGESTERDPLIASGTSEPPEDYQQRRLRRWILKRVLPWVGLAVILFAIVLAVCIVIVTSGRDRRRRSGSADYDLIVKQYAAKADHKVEVNLNGAKATYPSVEGGCEATVAIIRHCDKSGDTADDAGDEHCGYLGYERNEYVASLFGDGRDVATGRRYRWPAPYRMYAMSPSRGGTRGSEKLHFRQLETLIPLSHRLGIPIDSQFKSGDSTKLSHELYKELRSGAMCGKVALVAWRHHEIPLLAQKLGCGPINGCPMSWDDFDFDSMWQIKYIYGPPRPNVSMPGLRISAFNETNIATNTPPLQASLIPLEKTPQLRATNKGKKTKTATNKKKKGTILVGKAAPEAHPSLVRKLGIWEVHGAITTMDFDPLAFSMRAGDYPPGGTGSGGRWITV